MASVVFMRGVNVGGRKTFKPGALARELAAFDVVNVGAAGTFVVRKTVREDTLRAELLRRLPFNPEIMICRASDLVDLVHQEPFPDAPSEKDIRRSVTVMARRPRTLPRLPLLHPSAGEWQVKIIGVSGRFALGLWRRLGRSLVYPNEIVEKNFGVSATTRSWNTISAIRDILEADRAV